MAYEVEDEVDWSDSPLDLPSSAHIAPAPTSVPTYRSPAVKERSHYGKSLFDLEVEKDKRIFGASPTPSTRLIRVSRIC